jgi:hypothetical protein
MANLLWRQVIACFFNEQQSNYSILRVIIDKTLNVVSVSSVRIPNFLFDMKTVYVVA